MPVDILRPNGVCTNFISNNVAATGAASANAATSDVSDASYIRRSGGYPAYAMVQLETATVDVGDDVIIGVAAAVRAKSVAERCDYGYAVRVALQAGDGSYYPSYQRESYYPSVPKGTSAIGDFTQPLVNWGLAQPQDIPWTQEAIDGLLIQLQDRAAATESTRAYVYEAFLNVYTLARPTVAVTAPTGTVTSSGSPQVALTVSNVVETWQTAQPGYDLFLTTGTVEVKIFTAAQVAASGFDPSTSTPVWSGTANYNLAYGDGSTASTAAIAIDPSVQLENDTTYRAYARADISGTPHTDTFGDWDYEIFTLDLPAVAAPTCTATADATNGRVSLSVAGPGATAGHTAPTASVECTANSGVTWEAVRGLTDVVLTDLDASFVAHDYEAPRGVDVTYRARVTTTYGGLRISSAWDESAAVQLAATGWNLKVPQTPALNVLGVKVTGDLPEDIVEDVSVFRPLNRPRPVVIAMANDDMPTDGSLTIRTTGESAWTALRAILTLQEPVYLETPYADSKWIRIINRPAVRSGVPASVRRSVTVSYVECDPAPEA